MRPLKDLSDDLDALGGVILSEHDLIQAFWDAGIFLDHEADEVITLGKVYTELRPEDFPRPRPIPRPGSQLPGYWDR